MSQNIRFCLEQQRPITCSYLMSLIGWSNVLLIVVPGTVWNVASHHSRMKKVIQGSMYWLLNLLTRSDTGYFCLHSIGKSKNRDPPNFKKEGKYNPGMLCLEWERARICLGTNGYHRKKQAITQTNVKFSGDSPMEEGKKVPCYVYVCYNEGVWLRSQGIIHPIHSRKGYWGLKDEWELTRWERKGKAFQTDRQVVKVLWQSWGCWE